MDQPIGANWYCLDSGTYRGEMVTCRLSKDHEGPHIGEHPSLGRLQWVTEISSSKRVRTVSVTRPFGRSNERSR